LIGARQWAVERWQSAVLRKIGHEFVPDDEHGLVVTTVRDAGYIAKLGLALELTDPGMQKSRSPWGLAFDFGMNDKRDSLRLFLNYANAMKGRKKLTWGVGLRHFYGVDAEKTDEQIAKEQETKGIELSSQVIPGEHFDAVRMRPQAQLRLIEGAEQAGHAEGALEALRKLMQEVRRTGRAEVNTPLVIVRAKADRVLALDYGPRRRGATVTLTKPTPREKRT